MARYLLILVFVQCFFLHCRILLSAQEKWTQVPLEFKALGVYVSENRGLQYIAFPVAESIGGLFCFYAHPNPDILRKKETPKSELGRYTFSSCEFSVTEGRYRIRLSTTAGEEAWISFRDGGEVSYRYKYQGKESRERTMRHLGQRERIQLAVQRAIENEKKFPRAVPALKLEKIAQNIYQVTAGKNLETFQVPQGIQVEVLENTLVITDIVRKIVPINSIFGQNDADCVIGVPDDLFPDRLSFHEYVFSINGENTQTGFCGIEKRLHDMIKEIYRMEATALVKADLNGQSLYGKGWTRDGYMELVSETQRSSFWFNPATQDVKFGFGWTNTAKIVKNKLSAPAPFILVEEKFGPKPDETTFWKLTLVFENKDFQYQPEKVK
ncbi:MAG: hypothetical protein HY602_01250 [Parcubacteria group bacterium]|nr:hypothetical protein [Parcubacteria group bacterium]